MIKNSTKSMKQSHNLLTLRDLFINELKELFNAEQKMLNYIQELISRANTDELKEVIEDHIDITEIQVRRIEEIFIQLNIPAHASQNDAIDGLIKETSELIGDIQDPMVRDSAIIASIQKIKHYEIACYGCLRTFAMVLGYDEASDLLQATLDEETLIDRKLTEIAEGFINEEANHL